MFFPCMKCFFPVDISILVDPKQISVVSKSEKHKKKKKRKKKGGEGLLPPMPVMPLGPFDLVACTTFPFSISPFFFFWLGPKNNILGGPCQQLLTLLTLKSATA